MLTIEPVCVHPGHSLCLVRRAWQWSLAVDHRVAAEAGAQPGSLRGRAAARILAADACRRRRRRGWGNQIRIIRLLQAVLSASGCLFSEAT